MEIIPPVEGMIIYSSSTPPRSRTLTAAWSPTSPSLRIGGRSILSPLPTASSKESGRRPDAKIVRKVVMVIMAQLCP